MGESGVMGCALLEAGGLPGRLLGVSSADLESSSNFLVSLAIGQAGRLQHNHIYIVHVTGVQLKGTIQSQTLKSSRQKFTVF